MTEKLERVEVNLILPELDEEDQPDILKQERKYIFFHIIENIGEEEFKAVYLSSIDNIRSFPFEDKRELCYMILEKLEDFYNFEFVIKININQDVDIENIFSLLEFLQFDYINFSADIIKLANIPTDAKNIEEFILVNSDDVIKAIDSYTNLRSINEITKIFLRTYYKVKLIELFGDMIKKEKMLILLRVIEKERNNEKLN